MKRDEVSHKLFQAYKLFIAVCSSHIQWQTEANHVIPKTTAVVKTSILPQ